MEGVRVAAKVEAAAAGAGSGASRASPSGVSSTRAPSSPEGYVLRPYQHPHATLQVFVRVLNKDVQLLEGFASVARSDFDVLLLISLLGS